MEQRDSRHSPFTIRDARALRGDLDNIVLMALRKEPERRYQSVEQLSADIQNYLEGRPVIARQDTLGYRTGKFVRRHKLGLAAATLVILSLVGGMVAAAYQARRAERRFQQVRRLANTFLFDFHDKIQNLAGSTEAREMVVKTALEYLDSLAQEAGGDPSLQLELAKAYQKVGDVQGNPRGVNLGHHEAALASYRKALALSQTLAARDGSNLDTLRLLGLCYVKVGDLQAQSGDIVGGAQTLQQGLRVAEPLAQRTGAEQDLVVVIDLYTWLGYTQLRSGDPDAALRSFEHARELVELRVARFPSDPARRRIASAHNHIGETLASMGDPAGALEHFRQAESIYEPLSRKYPLDPFYRRELKVVYQWLGSFAGDPRFINQGDRPAALRYYRQALALGEGLMAQDPKSAPFRFELAGSYAKIGDLLADSDPTRSAEAYRKALTIHRSLLESSPNDFRFVLRQALLLRSLAAPLGRLGDRPGALHNLRQALAILQTLTVKHPGDAQLQADLHATLDALGDVLLETGDPAGALELYRQALTLAETSSAARPKDLYAQWRLADSYASLGRYHAKLAASPQVPLAQRIERWREARAWRQKSLEVWDGWGRRAVSGVFNTTKREQAARALAQCEAALAKLGAKPGP